MNTEIKEFSRDSLLISNASYFSDWALLSIYEQFVIYVTSSSNGVLEIEQSSDGKIIEQVIPYNIVRLVNFEQVIDIKSKWYRIFYTNGDTNQLDFRVRGFGLNHSSSISINNYPTSYRLSNLDPFEMNQVAFKHPILQYVFNNAANNSGFVIPTTGYDDLFLYNDATDPSSKIYASVTDNCLFLGLNSSGTGTHTFSRIQSSFLVPYRPGIPSSCIFTGAFEKITDTDCLLGFGIADTTSANPNCGCFVGYIKEISDFCIVYFLDGVKYYIPSREFDYQDLNLDFYFFNIFKIDMGYLGFYGYDVYIMTSSGFKKLKSISFLNSYRTPFLTFSSLGFIANIVRNTIQGNSETVVGCGSYNISVNSPLNPQFTNEFSTPISPLTSYSSGTEHVAVVIKARSTFLGKPNFFIWKINHSSFYADSTKPIIIRFYQAVYNNSFSGFTNINQEYSTLEYSFNPSALPLPLGMILFHTYILEKGGKSSEIEFSDVDSLLLGYDRFIIMTIFSTGNITDALFSFSTSDFH